MKNPLLDSLSNFHFVEVKVKERSEWLTVYKLGSLWQEGPEGDRHHVGIIAIVNNFNNYTIIYYLTALSYWVGK